ncbi:MAG: hypothetical protein A3J93_00880 [Candidatus Magasanikbacteria bacterium RIFOXYC2_FULL_42_28]|uniref:Transmembrane protein n=1 Tax=Candidatus Magasanikbacteria bacterium RIFOXYC2_FULL_42_28 TaxID=1798704 RepID=A0A1F6NYA8_9BACT|nr:MAG: hypothetical protein A3J93_00880 [Candidatus Magasanikbacteria bacterium RIFOXYC2_FULL_42_28]
MDKKSKIFFIIFFTAIVASIAVVYYRYVNKRDYYVRLQVPCDQLAERCFVSECDPSEDSECPADPEERTSYYKIIEKKAYNLPNCAGEVSDCPIPSCTGDASCLEFLCENSGDEGTDQCASP